MVNVFRCLPASRDFCHLLIALANSLDPDQKPFNTLESVPGRNLEKVKFEKGQQMAKKQLLSMQRDKLKLNQVHSIH